MLFLALTSGAFAEARVALVIGNGQYERLGRLPNPANDASDMAAMLRGLGFQVVEGTDLGGRAFRRAISEFSRLARGADVALFYYSGHGLQFRSENYLIPVDAELDYELALGETIQLNDVIQALAGADTALVYIDACRSFPLDGTFLAQANERIAVVNGLARPNLSDGSRTFVGFSALPGKTASDGIGRNSPFTAAMLEFLPARGLDLNDVFDQVTDRVRIATAGSQVPQSFLSGGAGSLTLLAGDVAVASGNAGDTTIEERDYDRASRLDTIQSYRAFLAVYPGGLYAQFAKGRMEELENAVPAKATELPDKPPAAMAEPAPEGAKPGESGRVEGSPGPSKPASTLWDHNGSTVRLVAEGSLRRFLYVSPRKGMLDAGATRGTLLFEGERQGMLYAGTAYVFSKTCGPIGYWVEGSVSSDQRRVELKGQAPRRNSNCKISSYRDDHLVFSLLPD